MSADYSSSCWQTVGRARRACSRRPVFVVDYAGGLGACAQHLGAVVGWCLAVDDRHRMAITPDVTVRRA